MPNYANISNNSDLIEDVLNKTDISLTQEQTQPGRLLVVGAAVLDRIVYVSNLPRPGETVISDNMEVHPGGKGCNQALAAALAGAEVSLITTVGRDETAEIVLDPLSRAGVDLSRVIRVEDIPTASATIAVDGNGQNLIIAHSGAYARLSPEMLNDRTGLFEWADWVLVQNEIPRETTDKAIRLANRLNCRIIVNPAPFRNGDSLFSECIDFLVPNEVEAAEMFGVEDYFALSIPERIQRCQDIKAGEIIVTLGEKGVEVFGSDGMHSMHEPCRIEALDCVGAGDAFCGILAAFLAEGIDVERSIRLAQKGAALSTTRRGAQVGLPRREELLSSGGIC